MSSLNKACLTTWTTTLFLIIPVINGQILTLTISDPILLGEELNFTCDASPAVGGPVTWNHGTDGPVAEDDTAYPGYRTIYSAAVLQTGIKYRFTINECDFTRDGVTWQCQAVGYTPGSGVVLVRVPPNHIECLCSESTDSVTVVCTMNCTNIDGTIKYYATEGSSAATEITLATSAAVLTPGTCLSGLNKHVFTVTASWSDVANELGPYQGKTVNVHAEWISNYFPNVVQSLTGNSCPVSIPGPSTTPGADPCPTWCIITIVVCIAVPVAVIATLVVCCYHPCCCFYMFCYPRCLTKFNPKDKANKSSSFPMTCCMCFWCRMRSCHKPWEDIRAGM